MASGSVMVGRLMCCLKVRLQGWELQIFVEFFFGQAAAKRIFWWSAGENEDFLSLFGMGRKCLGRGDNIRSFERPADEKSSLEGLLNVEETNFH